VVQFLTALPQSRQRLSGNGTKLLECDLLILGAERDNMISPSEIEATARAYNTQAQIIPDVAHNSLLEQRWQSVAERILTWLNEQEVVNISAQVAEPARVLPL
jgi:alpha-beta hydrolase superfamily lysophospholipase